MSFDNAAKQVADSPLQNLMSRWGGGAGATAGANAYASGSVSDPKFEQRQSTAASLWGASERWRLPMRRTLWRRRSPSLSPTHRPAGATPRPGNSSVNGQRSRGPAPNVVKVLKPLRSGEVGRLDIRIIEVRRGERRLDARQYLEGDGFTCYTRKGICFTSEEFDELLAQRDRIRAALEGGQASAGGRSCAAIGGKPMKRARRGPAVRKGDAGPRRRRALRFGMCLVGGSHQLGSPWAKECPLRDRRESVEDTQPEASRT